MSPRGIFVICGLLMAGCANPACELLKGNDEDGAAGEGEPVADNAAEVLLDAQCAAVERCGCGSRDDCEAQFGDPIREMFDTLTGKAAFDADCFEQVLAELRDDACTDTLEHCDLFVGSKEVDTQCVSFYGTAHHASDCGPGLMCRSSGCGGFGSPPAERRGPGERCNPQAPTEICQVTLYCDEREPACVAELPDGAECQQWHACSTLSFCAGYGAAGTGVCTPRLQVGEPCDRDDDRSVCALAYDEAGDYSPTQCSDGTCQVVESGPALCSEPESVHGGG